jgi:hypothetical protein
MPEDAVPDYIVSSTTPRVGETQADYRERIALVQAEALERRQHELSEQCSPSKTPADRIRIWERLHQLPLPGLPSHRLISVIAANTGLSVDEVRAEQSMRAAAKTAAPAG